MWSCDSYAAKRSRSMDTSLMKGSMDKVVMDSNGRNGHAASRQN